MQREDLIRIAGITVAVGLVVFVIVQIANFARNSMTTEESDEIALVETRIDLADYSEPKTSVRMIHDGNIISKEDHRSIRIVITERQRIIDILRGYDGVVLKRRIFPNTANAYHTFLEALQYTGFTSEQSNAIGDDETGVCPRGERTIVELKEDGESVLRLWSASCKKSLGTLDANSRHLRELFQDQIPNYKDIVRGTRL